MTRPEPIHRIHDTTPVYSLQHDVHRGLFWQRHDITRKTARSVFVATHHGEAQLDRIALERRGNCVRAGVTYSLRAYDLPRRVTRRALWERLAS